MEKEYKDYSGMIVIHGTLYEFDQINKSLTTHENGGVHTYPTWLNRELDFVSGYYDGDTRELMPTEVYSHLYKEEQEELKSFKIPTAIMVDDMRASLTELHIQKFNKESMENNHGFYLVDDALSKRLNGELPEIQFDGITYIVDLQNLQISQKERPEIKFELIKNNFYGDVDFLYNTRTKTPSQIDPRISAMPQDTIIIRLSNLAKMDLVGYAKFNWNRPTHYVSSFSWSQPKLSAEIVPLHQTKIPEWIRRNQMEQEKFGKKQTEWPQFKRKKGRHL